MPTKPNCRECGLCCITLNGEATYCDVTEADCARLTKPELRSVTRMAGGPAIQTRWRTNRSGKLKGFVTCNCAFLKGNVLESVNCAIYERRPQTCRGIIKPGDRTCSKIRILFVDFITNKTHPKDYL